MKSLVRQIVEHMGEKHESGRPHLASELDMADELGANVDDVRIAVGMMAEQGLLTKNEFHGETVLTLSEKGWEEYRSYLGSD